MIKSEVKPLEEIKEMLTGYHKVLNTGCGGCSSVCLAGGMKEVNNLNIKLKLSFQTDKPDFQIEGFTVERQCENEFLAELDTIIKPYDAVLSMACGAGVQYLAERFPDKPVFPAVNSKFVGVNIDIGWYEERCKTCGDCILGLTGGICPVTMCAKSLFNGPCGGSREGKCEVNPDLECGWQLIYDRAQALGILDKFAAIAGPHDWSTGFDGGPRKVVREDQCIAGLEETP